MTATVKVVASHVQVEKANAFEIDRDNGYLYLLTHSYGERIAAFKEWAQVVISPDRGRDGRFVKRGS